MVDAEARASADGRIGRHRDAGRSVRPDDHAGTVCRCSVGDTVGRSQSCGGGRPDRTACGAGFARTMATVAGCRAGRFAGRGLH